MLILTRKVGESIQIGDEITVTVLGVQGMQVRLGINAPKNVAVDREEIAVLKASGSPKPAPTPAPAPVEDEPLYANRTEAEWRELLAQEEAARQPEGKPCTR